MKNDEELKTYAKRIMDKVFDEDSILSRLYALKLIIEAYHAGYHDGYEDGKNKD